MMVWMLAPSVIKTSNKAVNFACSTRRTRKKPRAGYFYRYVFKIKSQVSKMKKLSFLVLFPITLVLLSGCETMDIGGSPKIKSFPVKIISEPTGAKIEINDNYVGKTPMTVQLEGWETTRTFSRSHIIVAHPVKAGGQTQVKSFTGWSSPDLTYGDKIPEKIYFNMNLIRIPQKLDLKINK